jgi:hypothetical protein
VLQRYRSLLLYIINLYNTPGMNSPYTIINPCIIHNLPHLHMSWSINIINVIIQGLCVTIDNIHQGYIDPPL